MITVIDLQGLGLDAGAHLLVRLGLQAVPVGQSLLVRGSSPGWDVQLAAWCRSQGHACSVQQSADGPLCLLVQRGSAQAGRWRGALVAGHADLQRSGALALQADARWGLAARGATVEAGSPAMHFRLDQKAEVWADNVPELYRQACAAQWNADSAIDWQAAFELPDAVEDAVVQVLTYMIENEVAALVVPARFLGQLHPHFREVQALLSIQIADEARHIDVFTRRIRLKGREPALSTAGGQSSLKTLLDEPDFSVAEFLLSVLGEGTFVNLLLFLRDHAPDPVTREVARLAARDEARHVAFGMAHLQSRLQQEPDLRHRLAHAVQARNDALSGSAGLNEEVFDALVLLAAGALNPQAVAAGYQRVQQLMRDMAEGRVARLEKLGFASSAAQQLAALHTRNFM